MENSLRGHGANENGGPAKEIGKLRVTPFAAGWTCAGTARVDVKRTLRIEAVGRRGRGRLSFVIADPGG